MGYPRGPTEGGSGGNRGHSNMEHWGYTDEVKRAARKRRRLNDRQVVFEDSHEREPVLCLNARNVHAAIESLQESVK